MAHRANHINWKICLIQFVKGSWKYGELKGIKKLEDYVELHTVGEGFVGIIDDKTPIEEHKTIANEAIKISTTKIQSGNYDIVILDEVNYAINLGLVKLEDILNLIKSKPSTLDLILTGNHAKDEIIELADLVTEMKEVKHPFQQGKKAKKGIDF